MVERVGPGLEERPDLAQHAFRRRAHHRSLEAGRLAVGQEPGDLHVPARGRPPEERNQRRALRGAQRPLERLQHGHVGLALSVLLDALAVQDMEVGTPHRRGAEELFQERGLADAGLARDEDELTLTLAGHPETLVEAAQLGVPSDEPDTGLDRAGGGGRLVPDLSHLPHEPKAAPVDRLDEPWRSARVSQRPAQLDDPLGERVIRDGDVGPDFLAQGLLGDEDAGPPDEAEENIPGLGSEGDLALPLR